MLSNPKPQLVYADHSAGVYVSPVSSLVTNMKNFSPPKSA
jgi:hypothetical protein